MIISTIGVLVKFKENLSRLEASPEHKVARLNSLGFYYLSSRSSLFAPYISAATNITSCAPSSISTYPAFHFNLGVYLV